MEERVNSIPIHSSRELPIAPPDAAALAPGRYTRHFTQTEDFFIRFDAEFTTPRFRIHHDYRQTEPSEEYLAALAETERRLIDLAPEVFAGLTYFFDPLEIFKPCYYKLYQAEEALFLYLLRIDLGFRPHYQTIVERGDNDVSHKSRTRCLFLEPLFIPLTRAEYDRGRLCEAGIKTLISETWIGEYGRGYFVQGIWIDNDLTKFFSRLFLSPERRLYPYYPLLCKYRTMCAAPVALSEAGRAPLAALLRDALRYLEPALSDIQAALKAEAFTETLPVFQTLKQDVASGFDRLGAGISLRSYLNEFGTKEYQIEETASPGA